MSSTSGAISSTTALHLSKSLTVSTSSGQVITGGAWKSFTMIFISQIVSLSQESIAVNSNTVSPTGNKSPELKPVSSVWNTSGIPQLSIAIGYEKFTNALHHPIGASTITGGLGQLVNTGGVLSPVLNVSTNSLAFPQSSVAVNVTSIL